MRSGGTTRAEIDSARPSGEASDLCVEGRRKGRTISVRPVRTMDSMSAVTLARAESMKGMWAATGRTSRKDMRLLCGGRPWAGGSFDASDVGTLCEPSRRSSARRTGQVKEAFLMK